MIIFNACFETIINATVLIQLNYGSFFFPWQLRHQVLRHIEIYACRLVYYNLDYPSF